MNCPRCGLSVDEHPASRCLDAWVAEAVMGLNVVSCDWPCGYGPDCGRYEASMQAEARYSWYAEKGPVYWEDVHGVGWGWPPWVDEDHGDLIACVEPVPFYSASMIDAGRVIKKLHAGGYTVWLTLCHDGHSRCSIGQIGKDAKASVTQGAWSQGGPLAICRSALEAMGRKL